MTRAPDPVTPTRDGSSHGVDGRVTWAFEPAEVHWDEQDARHVVYWRSRSSEERLAQANEYRIRVHGSKTPPAPTSWRFVDGHPATR